MASIRRLKKEINYTLSEIIDTVLIWEILTNNQNSEKGQKIIESALESYNLFLSKINDRSVENRCEYLKSVNQEFEKEANSLVEKINQLG